MTKDVEAEKIETAEETPVEAKSEDTALAPTGVPTSDDEGEETVEEVSSKEGDKKSKEEKVATLDVSSSKSNDEDKKKVKKLSQKAYEVKVHELADSGLTSEKIGQKLRDEGIHPNDYEGKISKILGEKYVNADLKNVEEKFDRIEKHFKTNKQDKRAKREKDRIFSQIRKIKKYFGIEIIKKRNMKKVRK